MAIQTCILLHSWLKYSIIEYTGKKRSNIKTKLFTRTHTYIHTSTCIRTYRKQMLEQMRTVWHSTVYTHFIYADTMCVCVHPSSKHFSLFYAQKNDASKLSQIKDTPDDVKQKRDFIERKRAQRMKEMRNVNRGNINMNFKRFYKIARFPLDILCIAMYGEASLHQMNCVHLLVCLRNIKVFNFK